MNYLQLEEIANSLEYGNGNIISKTSDYVLTKPLNTWDTNYRLYDKKEDLIYLVDFEDVHNNINGEYEGILFQDLTNLNIEEIKDVSWKTIAIEHEENEF